MTGDHQCEAAADLRLLHETQRLCRTSDSNDVRETFFENRLSYGRLEGIVVH
jgi:hypothetical protein